MVNEENLVVEQVIGNTYYFDSNAADDTGDGSVESPWKSLDSLEQIDLAPGDRILLKRGSQFFETLEIAASGETDNPIVVDAYGTGAKPIISAGRLIPQGAGWTDRDALGNPLANGEFRFVLGPTSEFTTSVPVLARTSATGENPGLVEHGIGATIGSLSEDTYITANEGGQRVLYYKPPSGREPTEFEFEVSRLDSAVRVTGDWVEVREVEGKFGNGEAVLLSEGSNVRFENCHATFGKNFGVVVRGADSTIDGCVAEHNYSTGLYIQTASASNSTIQYSTSRYNGNLILDANSISDRGGIGVQANNATVEHNIIHDNGNTTDTDFSQGDDAISLFDHHNTLVANNFIYNSAGSAIGMSETANSFGHRILDNVIANWNLYGVEGTARGTYAIGVFGNNTQNSGNFTIEGNRVFSNQTDTTQIGIQVALSNNQHRLWNTSVQDNVVYLLENADDGSVGLRVTREHLFEDVTIDFNNVLVPQTERHYLSFASDDGTTPIFETFATAAQFFAVNGYEENGLNQVDSLFIPEPELGIFNAGFTNAANTHNDAPIIASGTTVKVEENTTLAIDVDAADDSDGEGSGLTYRLIGGADIDLFDINPDTGEVSFNSPPNFESPDDANSDNIYEILLGVTDSTGLGDSQRIEIEVENVNEAPRSTGIGDFAVTVNAPDRTIDLSTIFTDEDDGDVLSYSVENNTNPTLVVDTAIDELHREVKDDEQRHDSQADEHTHHAGLELRTRNMVSILSKQSRQVAE